MCRKQTISFDVKQLSRQLSLRMPYVADGNV
jgi:hypothetical protein